MNTAAVPQESSPNLDTRVTSCRPVNPVLP